MSNGRQFRRRIIRQAIDTAMRAQGCTCGYDVVHKGARSVYGVATTAVRIEHDANCTMIGRRQLIVVSTSRGCTR